MLMGDEFYRLSTVTGKKYNVFDCVKILNLKQCMFYMENDIFPDDIKIIRNEKGEKCFLFYYNKDATRDVYNKWLSQKK